MYNINIQTVYFKTKAKLSENDIRKEMPKESGDVYEVRRISGNGKKRD